MWKTLLEVIIGGVGGDALGSTSCYNNACIREEVLITTGTSFYEVMPARVVAQVGRG